eukprot:gene8219-9768_t
MGAICSKGFKASGRDWMRTTALWVLQEENLMTTVKGQVITAASMIDDVLSLVLLAMMEELRKNETEQPPGTEQELKGIASEEGIGLGLVKPIIASCTITLGAVVWKYMVEMAWESGIGKRLESEDGKLRKGPCLLLVVLNLALWAWIADYTGSTHLLGAFLGGVAFTEIKGMEEMWQSSIGEQMLPWMVTFFFTCSVGFVIPLGELVKFKVHPPMLQLSGEAPQVQAHPPMQLAGYGLVLTLAAILGKFCSGAWATNFSHPAFMVLFTQVGTAMVGRGELGFVLARSSLEDKMMGEEAFSVTVWALVLATILGPFMFRASLKLKEPEGCEDAYGGGKVETEMPAA